MQDKISLLMEETGCGRGEAELVLEMCGYDLEAAVKAAPRLVKNIVVVKAKFAASRAGPFGIALVIFNTKGGILLRSRAVVSLNPAVYSEDLSHDWFAFEKSLYGRRLWEGSLQSESLDVERRLGAYFHAAGTQILDEMSRESEEALRARLAGIFESIWPGETLSLKISRDILDLAQYRSLQNAAENGLLEGKPKSAARASRGRGREEDILILKVVLEEAAEGVAADALRSGDMVLARITDGRDIAQYLARLFGGYSDDGPIPVMAPVEAVESVPDGVLARVRFSLGVCGDAVIARDSLVKATRVMLSDAQPWWRRFFSPRPAD
ncbi:MAG: UBA domain-containing protein [Elusimicrobiota bacterium]